MEIHVIFGLEIGTVCFNINSLFHNIHKGSLDSLLNFA